MPPAAWSARLAACTALYSSVSGAAVGWPRTCSESNEPRGLSVFHWPLRSGYLDSSAAWAAPNAAHNTAAGAINLIDRQSMAAFSLIVSTLPLKAVPRSGRQLAHEATPLLYVHGRRGRVSTSGTETA